MAKMRIHELAKMLTQATNKEISSKDVQSALAANGIEGKTASSNIEDKEIDIVKKYLTPKKEERMPQEKKNNEKRAEQPQGNEKRVEKKQESAQGKNAERVKEEHMHQEKKQEHGADERTRQDKRQEGKKQERRPQGG